MPCLISPRHLRGFLSTRWSNRPNRLGESFSNTLFHHTGGNPLFTTELLHSLVSAVSSSRLELVTG